MGWIAKLLDRFQEPHAYVSAGSEPPQANDRAVLESIADFDEDPDVRRAARELLLSDPATRTPKSA